ncbi:delta-60 repeat domain-containing protein [Niabella ginsengisoli]|uniref:Delta-60 repeat domain-containing protein n=1 Tax=Niabella ginsengisoli TaxID=522298 RepID=A0ABS9SG39_9BACT|nr:delta-60 repeat domain-containing protein [Niabella ginsengisoli]MCH5597295.1 delta-60 repeat domain-containing protein [Niabella ginsengisoli]
MLTNGASGTGLRPVFNIGTVGLNGVVTSAFINADDKIIAGGVFSSVNSRGNISNITRFHDNGMLDTTAFDIAGDGSLPTAIGPSFNGGFTGAVNKLYNTSAGVVAIGNYTDYNSILYERSTSESPYIDKIRISQIARLNVNGGIDSSFNLNVGLRPVQGYTSANGYVFDGVETPGNKLLLIGNFTTFENQSAGRIVRIDLATGRRDPSFAAAGANGSINKITYNSTTHKLLLTGTFTSYNGQAANGIVMIDENGNVDNTFNFKPVEGGIPNFAGQLNDGKIMVSGTFNKYDGIVRPGFMVLNPDGSLAVGYNNIGYFDGVVNDFIEFPSDTDPTITYVMLVGSFFRYDSKDVGNIVKIRFQN